MNELLNAEHPWADSACGLQAPIGLALPQGSVPSPCRFSEQEPDAQRGTVSHH